MTLGEGYVDGKITVENAHIYDFLDLATRIMRRIGSLPLSLMAENLSRVVRYIQQFNFTQHARRNVAHHYDLSRQLFELFLDIDRQYSCTYFDRPDDDIETAQINKKRHIAAKLLLANGQCVLNIGCGWGGLGLYLAKKLDLHVTGITLSEEQHAVTNERALNEPMAGRATFDLRDYREQTGPFNRVVSIGMFEHVGIPFYRTFFDKVRDLMKPDGVMPLHTIGHSNPPTVTDPRIRKYICPSGYIPAQSEVMPAIEDAGLTVIDIEFLGPHYAETLRACQNRFQANREKVKAL